MNVPKFGVIGAGGPLPVAVCATGSWPGSEGAVPASATCNAACVGCLSDQEDGMPPASHARIAAAPGADAMAEVAAAHLAHASGRVMVSFGQGCEGEPLLRWREVARATRLMRERTQRGSINANTNGSMPRALAALADAGLDAVRPESITKCALEPA